MLSVVRAVASTLATGLLGGMVLAGCADDGGDDLTTGTLVTDVTVSGYREPIETVSALLETLAVGGWDEAAAITVEDQMALVALAEGADLETVADYLRVGERGVGANFWAGFARITEDFLEGSLADLTVVGRRDYEAEGVSFVDFQLALPTSSEDRSFKLVVARSDDLRWRVDVVATFVEVLALRLSETAEIARATRTEDAATVTSALERLVPSLQATLTDPDLGAESSQAVRSALAAIG